MTVTIHPHRCLYIVKYLDTFVKVTEKLGFKEDYERGSERVIYDVRQGKLGGYTLDRYEEMSALDDE